MAGLSFRRLHVVASYPKDGKMSVNLLKGDSLIFAGNFGELALLAGLVWTDWSLKPGRQATKTSTGGG
jgi:hypothetical protein